MAIGKTTASFNAVMMGLVRHGQTFERLARTQKASAANVSNHNRWDVQALQISLNTVTEDDHSIIDKAASKCLH